jgi:hypothetical protein
VRDEDYQVLVRRASEQGISVPEWLRQEIRRLVARNRRRPRGPVIANDEVLGILDEWRGPWPDEDRQAQR